MKTFSCLLTLLGALLLNACGDADSTSQVHAGSSPQLWRLHPANNLENCLVPNAYIVRNDLVSPPLISTKYRPDFKACSSNYSLKDLIITNFNGNPWNGENYPVTITSKNLTGHCLYNPGNFHSGTDNGDLVWIPCNLSSSNDFHEKQRRTFWIKKDQRGNYQIRTEYQTAVGIPNGKVECVEIVDGTGARRRPCIGLHMWKFKRQ